MANNMKNKMEINEKFKNKDKLINEDSIINDHESLEKSQRKLFESQEL